MERQGSESSSKEYFIRGAVVATTIREINILPRFVTLHKLWNDTILDDIFALDLIINWQNIGLKTGKMLNNKLVKYWIRMGQFLSFSSKG